MLWEQISYRVSCNLGSFINLTCKTVLWYFTVVEGRFLPSNMQVKCLVFWWKDEFGQRQVTHCYLDRINFCGNITIIKGYKLIIKLRNMLSPVQTDVTLLANNSQHCWMLNVASVCTPCCMLLDVVACCCAKFKTKTLPKNGTCAMGIDILKVSRLFPLQRKDWNEINTLSLNHLHQSVFIPFYYHRCAVVPRN